MKNGDMLEFVIEVAREAGAYLKESFGRLAELEIKDKSPRNVVTEADVASEKLIRARIAARHPDHAVIGEEMPATRGVGLQWHIDPIDGTMNFACGIAHWSVSLGVCDAEGEKYGVVYDPMRGELFSAERGRGAFLNGARLRVKDKTDLDDAIFATGFAGLRGASPDYGCLARFERAVRRCRGMRRLGSAALDLAYVAAGRFDLFFEEGLASWDMAGGALLVREAGGVVTDFAGGRDYFATGQIVAANPALSRRCLAELVAEK